MELNNVVLPLPVPTPSQPLSRHTGSQSMNSQGIDE